MTVKEIMLTLINLNMNETSNNGILSLEFLGSCLVSRFQYHLGIILSNNSK